MKYLLITFFFIGCGKPTLNERVANQYAAEHNVKVEKAEVKKLSTNYYTGDVFVAGQKIHVNCIYVEDQDSLIGVVAISEDLENSALQDPIESQPTIK